MSLKETVPTKNWKALYNAPFAAAVYVALASGGTSDFPKELFSAGKFISEQTKQSGETGYGELVDELTIDLKNMPEDEAKAITLDYQGKHKTAIRSQAKQAVADAAAVVAELAGADGYRRWLLDAARRAAETKSGGFLGIGAKAEVDEKEQAALDELKSILGM
jgi:hypothetical protein